MPGEAQPVASDAPRARRAWLLLGIAVLVVVFVVGERLSTNDPFARHLWANLCWTLSSAAAAGACWQTASGCEGHLRVAWRAFAAGSALWCAGLLVWSFYELVLQWVTPFPTIAELGFLGLVPCFALGISRLGAAAPSEAVDTKRLGDLGIVIAVLVMIFSIVFWEPTRDVEESSLYVLTALAYPVLHLGVLVFALLSLWQHRWGTRRRILLVLLLALAILAATTTLYGGSLLLRTYEAGNELDVFWVIFFLVVVWAAREELWHDASGARHEARLPELDALVPALAILAVALTTFAFRGSFDAALVPVWAVAGIGLSISLGLRLWGAQRAEQRLREQIRLEQARHVTLANAAPVGLARVDESGLVSESNASFDAFVGDRPRSLADPAWQESGLVELVARAREGAPATAASPEPIRLGEIWVRAQATALAGAERGVLLALLDVTLEHRMQEEAQRGQKMQAVGALAGGIAHDFNNLLAGAIASVTLLRRRGPMESETGGLVDHLEQSLWRAAELTNRLLALARKRDSVVTTVDAVTVVKRVVTLLSRSLDETIAVRESVPRHPVPFRGDVGDLEHALLNLGLNARDAMADQDGGEITYALALEGEGPERQIVIRVSDTGPGVPEELRSRIFDAFFTTKDPGEGTGLGLAMVQRFAIESKGSVSLRSEPGRGAVFELRLPEALDAPPLPDAQAEELVLGKGTVLVVDDRDGALFAMKAILSECGYDVVVAGNGVEALTELQRREGALDLVVTDAVMRRMGGRELLRTMRARGYTMPVILMTGHDPERHRGTSGFAATIRKPFDPAQASRVVKAVIDGDLASAADTMHEGVAAVKVELGPRGGAPS